MFFEKPSLDNAGNCCKWEPIAMVASKAESEVSPVLSLEEFMANPPDHMEWVDGKQGKRILSIKAVCSQ